MRPPPAASCRLGRNGPGNAGAALPPGEHLCGGITQGRDHRRSAQQLAPRLDNPLIEILDMLAH
ncbi:hypothetical protein AAHB37_14245 [Glutamicibacter halophytocola]|uniref:hypothetical protein n=1 Tax=Glutamicibacter halophytocola TaxID=1933880 RepID=UPI00321AD63E